MLNLKTASFQVNTDLHALGQVLTWFDQFNQPPLSHQVWLQCQLILVEGFTNVVRHAHKDCSPETLIDIQVALLPESLEIKIWDSGPSFDFNQVLKALPLEANQDAENGRGLRLMQRIADQLNYIHTPDGRNCLLMTKYYSTPEQQGRNLD